MIYKAPGHLAKEIIRPYLEEEAPYLIDTEVSNGAMATLLEESFSLPVLLYQSGYILQITE